VTNDSIHSGENSNGDLGDKNLEKNQCEEAALACGNPINDATQSSRCKGRWQSELTLVHRLKWKMLVSELELKRKENNQPVVGRRNAASAKLIFISPLVPLRSLRISTIICAACMLLRRVQRCNTAAARLIVVLCFFPLCHCVAYKQQKPLPPD